MRFATWNLDWWHRSRAPAARVTLIERTGADIVALQEVSSDVANRLRDHRNGPCVFSQEVYPPATWRWMGCGLLFPQGARLVEAGVVEGLPKPQRSLWATAEFPDVGQVTVVSWHTPNAAGDGREVKMAAYETMTDWLAGRDGPVLLGADLNTWRDPVDLIEPELGEPFAAEHGFVGPEPAHGLVDAYRRRLQGTGALEDLRRHRPEGPLAVSHVLADGSGHRMDRIFISPEILVHDASYAYHEAIAAGSDHALHWADIAFNSGTGHQG